MADQVPVRLHFQPQHDPRRPLQGVPPSRARFRAFDCSGKAAAQAHDCGRGLYYAQEHVRALAHPQTPPHAAQLVVTFSQVLAQLEPVLSVAAPYELGGRLGRGLVQVQFRAYYRHHMTQIQLQFMSVDAF
jgi:hypothetical protein